MFHLKGGAVGVFYAPEVYCAATCLCTRLRICAWVVCETGCRFEVLGVCSVMAEHGLTTKKGRGIRLVKSKGSVRWRRNRGVLRFFMSALRDFAVIRCFGANDGCWRFTTGIELLDSRSLATGFALSTAACKVTPRV